MTTTETPPTVATRLRGLADAIEASGLPAPRVTVNWFSCDDTSLARIIAAFPDLEWHAHASDAGTEWVEARRDQVEFNAFATSPARTTTPRLAALLAEQVTA